jgi:hypothetical protein
MFTATTTRFERGACGVLLEHIQRALAIGVLGRLVVSDKATVLNDLCASVEN